MRSLICTEAFVPRYTEELELWSIFNFCTTLTNYIAEWCVIVRFRRCLECMYVSVVMYEEGEEGWRGNPVPVLAYCFFLIYHGPPGLTSPFNRRVIINGTYAFTLYALRRDLRFSPVIFGRESCNWGSDPTSPLVSRRNPLLKIPSLLGIEHKTAACKAVTLPLRYNSDWFQI